MDTLYVVVPCYNEEAVLPETSSRLKDKLRRLEESCLISGESRVLFVDDGSRDGTWNVIERLHDSDPLFCGLKLSRNRGHQNALLAGLMTAKDYADAVISMDADLQDDIEVMDAFLRHFHEGCDIVYGVRSARRTDSVFKRNTAALFYRLMRGMGVELVSNHADYRLMSRRALEELARFHETNLFLRGIVPLIGFRAATVPYERHERAAGKSKYPFRKMLSFAIEGITSFSIKPIQFITTLGVTIFFVSLVLLVYFLVAYLEGKTVHGWTTIVLSMWAIGGLELLAIGVIGEYIGKIYLETKARPKYTIERFLR